MAVQTLPNSGLKYNIYGDPNWNSESNTFNWNRLNNTLLKLSALLDVDVTGLNDSDVLQYNSASQKWEPAATPGGARQISTTTTTTSSSTTTTT